MNDAEGLTIMGWASIFDEMDGDGDIVRPGAFTASLRQRPQIGMLNNHDPMQVVGRWAVIEERGDGLWVEGTVVDESVARLVSLGAMFGLSIGYMTILQRHHPAHRELLEIDLREISITAMPMHPKCLIDRKMITIPAGNPFGPGNRSESY